MFPWYLTAGGSVAGAAPTLSSVTANGGSVGDSAGGYTLTLTGANLTGTSGVTVGGVAATAVSVVNSTTVTCTAPSSSSGSKSVVATTPNGSNGANTLFRYASFADYAFTGLWVASYPGTNWPATASAGVSSTTGALVAGVSPSVGTAANTRTPATMNGTTQYLTNATQLSTLFSTTAGTIFCVYRPAAAKTAQASGSEYLDPYCFGDFTNGGLGLSYSSGGFKGFLYDGAYKVIARASAVATPAAVTFTWNGSNLNLDVSGTAASPVAAGAFAAPTANSVAMGSSYNGVSLLQGDMFVVGCSNTVLSAGTIADLKSIANTRFNFSM